MSSKAIEVTEMNEQLKRCYAGWLAKLAGIRLGAPIEGWTYDKIQKEIGEIDGYLEDNSRFAADDDSNGPMIFIRALEDYSPDPSAEEIGKTWLNYAAYQQGMFWWGGYGISTEHTAYLNLASGIPAPRSGSMAQNGATVAEQIGGQIFIDTWGLVCPGAPDRAAELAKRAASVSHDGNGIYGGQFVAAAIALAYEERDIVKIIHGALARIPEDCEYARAVKAVEAFHAQHPDSWRDCFRYVFENWGYDRYPGNCHIIPNAAVMALAMFYGEGDFDRTLNIACMCGWDTDCNVGNVATILGVMNGLEGIDYDKWLRPINDGFAVSSVLGCLNRMDAPWCARYLYEQALRIAGKPGTGFDAYAKRYDFEFPGSTHSFESDAELSNPGGCLLCRCGDATEIFRRTYYEPLWYMDDRYSPVQAPDIWPGQTARFRLRGTGVKVSLFAVDLVTKARYETEETELNGVRTLELTIPADAVCVERVGVRCAGGELAIEEAEFVGAADMTIPTEKLPAEKHHSAICTVNQFTTYKGICEKTDGALWLSCADVGAAFTGDIGWRDYAFRARFTPATGGTCALLVRVEGALRLISVELSRRGLAIVRNGDAREALAECAYPFETGREYELTVECREGNIAVRDGNGILLQADCGKNRGAVGFGVRDGARMRVTEYAVMPL